MQWDLACSTKEYPNSVGAPIYAPTKLVIENYTTSVPGSIGLITNINSYLVYIGLILNVGHIDDRRAPSVGHTFEGGDIMAYIDKTQPSTSRPHTHFGLNTTEIPPIPPWSQGDNISWLNPFSHDPFNNGAYLSTGLWLPEFLPEKVQLLFKTRIL